MTIGWAEFSPCGRFRYELRRRYGEGPVLSVILLNPSRAGAKTEDATTRWLRGYCSRHGFGGIELGNVFPYIETHLSRDGLLAVPGLPLTPENWRKHRWALDQVFLAAKRDLGWVLCGWGDGVRKIPNCESWVSFVAARARHHGVELRALGQTRSGQPWHPLRKSHALVAETLALGAP